MCKVTSCARIVAAPANLDLSSVTAPTSTGSVMLTVQHPGAACLSVNLVSTHPCAACLPVNWSVHTDYTHYSSFSINHLMLLLHLMHCSSSINIYCINNHDYWLSWYLQNLTVQPSTALAKTQWQRAVQANTLTGSVMDRKTSNAACP